MSNVIQDFFGTTPEGRVVESYELVNPRGLRARLINYGALLTELQVPDRQGQLGDVVLGFDSLGGYLQRHPYFGCTTGRVANRIARGRFVLNGREYRLATNNGPNHLHGGVVGLDRKVWVATEEPGRAGPAMKFFHLSPDGEEGYPGNLAVTVVYTLTERDELRIDYEATTDQDTPVNLTNHTYFNLADGGRTDVLKHEVEIMADYYTPVDATSIPTGEIRCVDALMSFRQPTPIGARFALLGGDPGGYDHNYVLCKTQPGELCLAARVYEAKSGRLLELSTTEPGVQFYTGNYLDGSITGKGGAVYKKHHGFCLETQHFPDSVHHAHFPSILLPAGGVYRQTTVYRFACR